VTPVEEVMRTLDDAVRAGKVRHIGLSDVPAWYAARAQTLAELRGQERIPLLQLERARWAADLPPRLQMPILRTQIEISLHEGRGELESAREKMSELEAYVTSLHDEAQRKAALASLERWKAELSG
jgi:hypothetical protein